MKKGVKICAAFLAAIMMFTGCSLFQEETVTTSKTSTQKVNRGNLLLGLSADGSITLPVTGLDFAVSGIIKSIYVETGDMVKKGDLLAELDDSDLQLALKTAQNNLDKALLAYDDAVATAQYNLQSEQISLASTSEQLNKPFDSYTYDLAIENAQLTLERRQQDYDDTVAAALTAEEAARTTLTRRQADLADAEADLADAEAEAVNEYDIYTYINKVESAQNAVDRALKALNDAKKALRDAKFYYAEDMNSEDATTEKNAKEAYASYEKTAYNAQNTYDDALATLEAEKESMSNFENTETERIVNNVITARKAVASAKQAEEDARISLNNTLKDNSQKVTAARQTVSDAETALSNAKEDLARGEEAYNDDLHTTKNTYDLQSLKIENMTSSDSSIQNALYNIEDAKNALASAENDLAKIKITAPIDGEVLNVTKKEGEKVTENESGPGFFMGSSSTSNSFITIRDLSEIYMTASIPEGDIVGLAVGQQIRVAVDALGEENLLATVYSISSVPTTDSSGIISYQVIGKLDELNPEIRDSMSVFLTFVKREKLDVMLIPNKSVFVEDGQQYVYVQKDDGSMEKRAVTCGLSNGTQTEVVDGLQVGETVIVGKVNL